MQVALFMHWLPMQSSTASASHRLPLNLDVQVQVKELTPSVQLPPLRQEFGPQSSIFVEQFGPV